MEKIYMTSFFVRVTYREEKTKRLWGRMEKREEETSDLQKK